MPVFISPKWALTAYRIMTSLHFLCKYVTENILALIAGQNFCP